EGAGGGGAGRPGAPPHGTEKAARDPDTRGLARVRLARLPERNRDDLRGLEPAVDRGQFREAALHQYGSIEEDDQQRDLPADEHSAQARMTRRRALAGSSLP